MHAPVGRRADDRRVPAGIFDLYDWAAGEYKCCNGHINNRHWSVYCDNGIHAHPLPSSPILSDPLRSSPILSDPL